MSTPEGYIDLINRLYKKWICWRKHLDEIVFDIRQIKSK